MISQQTAEHEAVTVRRSSLLDEAIRHLQEQQDRENLLAAEAAAPPEPQGAALAPPPAPAPSTPRRGDSRRWFSFDHQPEEHRAHLTFFFPSLKCLLTSGRTCSRHPTWACGAVGRWRAFGRCTRTHLAVKWPQRETCRPGDGEWWYLNWPRAATGVKPVLTSVSVF